MTPKIPRVAIVSFPGNNCEVESIRAIKDSGMEPVFFRWNDDRALLEGIDGYFLVGGFSYEDRGRSGMAAAYDPIMEHVGREAEAGKVVIGNCNGAQVLVESGLIPLGGHLDMALAHNAVPLADGWHAPGFLSEWVWITPTCEKDRCATANWEGVMHLPIAHGEGRFTTRDKDLFEEMKKNNQIVFRYSDAEGNISEAMDVTPNGSQYAVAGICNPAGNVVALMPHPERTPNGKPYFDSVRLWIEQAKSVATQSLRQTSAKPEELMPMHQQPFELFIESIIVNNEERTVEQVARTVRPDLRLKQLKYFAVPSENTVNALLQDLTVFNYNKERAYLRRNGSLQTWDAASRKFIDAERNILDGIALMRRNDPDTGATGLPSSSMTGVCYVCLGIDERDLQDSRLRHVFANPHSSTLHRLS